MSMKGLDHEPHCCFIDGLRNSAKYTGNTSLLHRHSAWPRTNRRATCRLDSSLRRYWWHLPFGCAHRSTTRCASTCAGCTAAWSISCAVRPQTCCTNDRDSRGRFGTARFHQNHCARACTTLFFILNWTICWSCHRGSETSRCRSNWYQFVGYRACLC